MAIETLKQVLLELIAPTRCAGCERPGSVLCDPCIDTILAYRDSHFCPRCGTPYGELVCTECEGKEFAFERVVCLGELDGPLSRAVVIYKDAFEVRLGAVLGALLAHRCVAEFRAPDSGGHTSIDLVTWIPPTMRALRRRGYDHAGILAECVARALGVDCHQFLDRRATRDLRTLSREERLSEARDSYVYREDFSASTRSDGVSTHSGPPDLSDAHVLVVDDVLTTGATLNGAAQMLLDRGAVVVTGAVLARAW